MIVLLTEFGGKILVELLKNVLEFGKSCKINLVVCIFPYTFRFKPTPNPPVTTSAPVLYDFELVVP